MDIRIPQLSEGIEGGTVVSVLIAEGQAVRKEQDLLEIETKKAIAPIPSPAAGTVRKIHVKAGDDVAVGQVVVSLATDEAAGAAVAEPSAPTARPAATPRPAARPAASGPMVRPPSPSGAPPPAAPSIRRMAMQLGLDLSRVSGSGYGGRITLEDLQAYVAQAMAGGSGAQAAPAAPRVDFAKWGPVTEEPLSPVRRAVADQMTSAWSEIPHVTQFDDADVTAVEALRKRYGGTYEQRGAKLTLTAFILKAVVAALKAFPRFNASLQEADKTLILKRYYHLGVAVDTEAGLMVPVLREADRKNLLTISAELQALAEKARARKVTLEELQGGTFTISNLGGIGGAHFTPIINRPEVAILGVGRGVMRPVLKDGTVEGRLLLPLALSYDHRVVDGADGARFIRAVVEALERFPEADVKLS